MPNSLLITPDHQLEATAVDFPTQGSHLQWFYDTLDVRCITCVRPMPGSILFDLGTKHGVTIDCWGDDEGLLVNEPQINGTIMALTEYPGVLVGNWVILTSTPDGETHELPAVIFDTLTQFLSLTPSDTTVA